MPYVLGLDSSTTATKALLVDESGVVVASGVAEYDYETPHPLWAEQDPRLWWAGAVTAIRRCLADLPGAVETIEGIGLTGQMHGLVLLDEAASPVRPAILWNDQRSGAECDELRARVGRERLIATSGNDAMAGFTASKLLWVRNHEPDHWAAAAHVLLPKDYVRLRLTGDLATDRAGASGTQLFDLSRRDWSLEMLELLELEVDLFPETHEGPSVTGAITSAAAAETGLPAGVPVVAGAGDQAANAVGTGAIDSGQMTLSLGTSGVIFAAGDEPAIEPAGRVHAFCHALPERWHLMGVMLSAAGSLRWLRDTFAPRVSFEELSKEAAEVAPGADGLLFLPYLSGERTPHPDPLARGAFIGLTVRHGRGHLVRALMEGVAFGLRDGFELITATGVEPRGGLRASGGGITSPVWRQILADVLDQELATVNTPEGAAYGAACLAAVGAGWGPSAADLVAGWVEVTGVTTQSGHDYSGLYGLFDEQYPLLRDTFTALGD